MSADPIKYNTRTLVNQLAERTQDVLESFSDTDIKLLGEVIHCWQSSSFTEVSLVDTNDEGVWFRARLPRHLPSPEIGDVVGIVGRLTCRHDGGNLDIRLDGNGFDKLPHVGQHHRKRVECFQRVKEETKEVRLRPMPWPIKSVALVTGAHSKAEADFVVHLNKGKFNYTIVPFPVRLDTPEDIAKGIDAAADRKDLDILVIARGGGSAFDMFQFDHPSVLSAIGRAVQRKYVVTALGHTSDGTLADQLAHQSETVPAIAADTIRESYFKNNPSRQDPATTNALPPPKESAPERPRYRSRRFSSWARFKFWLERWMRRLFLIGLGAAFGFAIGYFRAKVDGSRMDGQAVGKKGPSLDDRGERKRTGSVGSPSKR